MNNNNVNETSTDDLLDKLFSDESENKVTRSHHSASKKEVSDLYTSEQENDKEEQNSSVAVSALEWLEMFVACFTVVLLIVSFVARHSPVIGSSMADTLHEKDVVIVRELFYEPKQGDIVVAQSVPLGYDEPIVKRIIATGGQTVDIDFETWSVTVDGTPLDEPYVLYRDGVAMTSKDISFPLTVPEGYLFVMGDNRNGSMDSRDSRVGLIDERMVVGQVVFRLAPFNAIGKLS